MRILIVSALVILAVPTTAVLAPPAAAQEREIREANLPRAYEERLLELFGGDAATRITGGHAVERGEVQRGNLALSEGVLRVDGRVEGDVAVLGGDVVVGRRGEVTGEIVVLGGAARLLDGAIVGGDIVEFSRSVREAGRGGGGGRDRRGFSDGPGPDERSWAGHEGRTSGIRAGSSTFLVHGGSSYNRVEGLPLTFGPSIRTSSRLPLRLQALAIWRTAAEPSLGTERWGYRGRLEQFVDPGGMIRVGGTAFSVVEPLDRWQLTDAEASLATLGFHQDFRDHFGREGWSAYLGLRPVRGVDLQLEYLEVDHRSVGAGDPWTLFGRSHAWRLQPLVAEGELRSAVGRLELDFTDDRDDPYAGFYGRLQMIRPVGGSLARPALSAASAEELVALPVVPTTEDVPGQGFSTDFTSLLVDLRSYAPVGPLSQLNFRVVAGGNVDEGPLPPQYQHALGGPGSLPGFSAFRADCGARSVAGVHGGAAFYPGYGCDRFVLGQVEYRGRFFLDLGFGEPEADHEDRGWTDFHADFDPRWMVFANAGQGWAYDAALPDGSFATGALYDAGAGFLLDDLGVYFAIPLNSEVERDARFFVRLQRRF